MFTAADKSNTTHVNRQQQRAGTTFFRKAGEDTFFGATQQDSFFSPAVQAKLTVSSPDDPQEKEADAVADQVMRMPDPVSMPAGREADQLQKKEEETRGEAPLTEMQHPVISRMVQCKPAAVQTKLAAAIQRSYLGDDVGSFAASDCSCAGSDLYRKHLSLYPSDVVQLSGRGPPTGSIQFEQSLSASKGGGSVLPLETRQFMERRFNADFSGVRIHTGSQAEGLSAQIHAQAFTHGNDIYFNSGKYSPNTTSGGLLLAHELTHTIQQGASRAHTGNASAVARKPVIQRNDDTPVNQPETAIQAKDESEQEEVITPAIEPTIQPKNELSSWSINGGGELVQPKEEEQKEEDEKESTAPTPLIQKQHDIGDCCNDGDGEQVQRSVIDDALSYIDSVTDCISLDLDVAKACALQKAQQVALHIPGYRALRVVLGRDPITSDNVDRNGRNFLEAAFDLMPGGLLLHQKLEAQHQLDAAAAWIDDQIARVENLVNGLFSQIGAFWHNLGISDLASPMEVLRNAADIIMGFINRVIDFAVAAATELLAMIKEYLLTKIVDFIKEQTTAYPLLRVILGRDPVTDEEVPTNGTNILNALLELGGEEGIQQRTQMQETGTFQKAVDFIDEGISLFSHTYDELVAAFHNIWNVVTIDSLMDPVGTFTLIYNQFAGPVGRVLDFVLRVGAEILKFIKEVLMQRLSAWAREQRGYELVTVLIGKDPFTNAVVLRNVENIIKGFMSLMEGGREQFEQLKESGAIDRTVAKIDAAVARLNMTPAYIVQLFIDLWNSFSIQDLANPIAAFQRIIERFGEPIGRLIAFVIQIVKIVIEGILIIMNFPFDLINNIIAKAMQAFEMIKRDPVGFLKNLLRAIKQGFIQFFENILQHLLTGLVGWLTSELRDAGVPAFSDTSLRGIISWVLEVLGISMEKIWEKLAAHPRIGPQRVARIRSLINTLEGIWTFIRDVQERGMAAVWERIQEQLSNLWNTILEAVKNWIMEQIVNRMVTRLLSMLDPTGIMAVVNSVVALYNAIQSFIRYLREMLEIVNSFVEGVVDIASGNITTAANYLERTLARAVPIVIGFLANQVGLNGIGHRVGEMIGRAQEMVDQALTWLVNRAVDTAFNLIDRLMGRGGEAAGDEHGTDNQLEKPLHFGGEGHTIKVRRTGSLEFQMASATFVELSQQLNSLRETYVNNHFARAGQEEARAGLDERLIAITRRKNEILRQANAARSDQARQNDILDEGEDELVNMIEGVSSYMLERFSEAAGANVEVEQGDLVFHVANNRNYLVTNRIREMQNGHLGFHAGDNVSAGLVFIKYTDFGSGWQKLPGGRPISRFVTATYAIDLTHSLFAGLRLGDAIREKLYGAWKSEVITWRDRRLATRYNDDVSTPFGPYRGVRHVKNGVTYFVSDSEPSERDPDATDMIDNTNKKLTLPSRATIDHDPPVAEHWTDLGGNNTTQDARRNWYNAVRGESHKIISRELNSSLSSRGATYSATTGTSFRGPGE